MFQLLAVVAEGTAEVAAACKYSGSYLSWKVQQSGFLKSAYFHDSFILSFANFLKLYIMDRTLYYQGQKASGLPAVEPDIALWCKNIPFIRYKYIIQNEL